jgi:DNA-binding transcriptional MerR regulator
MLSPKALAQLSCVSSDTLRHYERLGLLKPERTSAGYRRYPPECVDRVRLIRRAMMVGFSLKHLARIFAERESGRAPCYSVRAYVETHLAEVNQRQKELRLLKRDLKALLRDWDAKLAMTPPGKQARLLEQLASRSRFGKS